MHGRCQGARREEDCRGGYQPGATRLCQELRRDRHCHPRTSLCPLTEQRLRQVAKNQGEDSDDYAARASEELRKQFGIPALGRGAIDLVIDATGAPSCVAMSLHLLKPAYVCYQRQEVSG